MFRFENDMCPFANEMSPFENECPFAHDKLLFEGDLVCLAPPVQLDLPTLQIIHPAEGKGHEPDIIDRTPEIRTQTIEVDPTIPVEEADIEWKTLGLRASCQIGTPRPRCPRSNLCQKK